jgi:hypothetical protein
MTHSTNEYTKIISYLEKKMVNVDLVQLEKEKTTKSEEVRNYKQMAKAAHDKEKATSKAVQDSNVKNSNLSSSTASKKRQLSEEMTKHINRIRKKNKNSHNIISSIISRK